MFAATRELAETMNRRHVLLGAAVTGGGILLRGPRAAVAANGFSAFLAEMAAQARAGGVSSRTVDQALAGLRPDPAVIEADGRQPEFTRAIWDYLDGAVSARRVERGLDRMGLYAGLLRILEERYGVPGSVLTAIWGLESDFGANFGGYSVVRSLATLGYSGRRTRFGREQLLAALTILDSGDISPERMVGSWAGAMGHTQFIPTTYLAYARDFDGDGRRDIWQSVPDALASTANYLTQSGWRPGEPWGMEAALPPGMNLDLIDRSNRQPAAFWSSLGVSTVTGAPLPASDGIAIILPAGIQGPAFALYPNFRAILRYNNATAYALAVGHLSDRLVGGAPIAASWPRGEQPIGRSGRERLQRLLTQRGYDTGGIDGIIGPRTRAALRAYQRDAGLPADGFATVRLLNRLASGG